MRTYSQFSTEYHYYITYYSYITIASFDNHIRFLHTSIILYGFMPTVLKKKTITLSTYEIIEQFLNKI